MPSQPPPAFEAVPPDDPASSSELSRAQVELGIYTWLWDLPSNQVRWTADLSPLLGLPPGSFGGKFADFLRSMHPDDVEASRNRLRACMRGDLPTYRAEERVVWPDGSVHWLETYGRAARGADGRTLSMVGVVRDITDWREARTVLESNEQRLRRLIEDAPLAVGMSRGDLILYGNAAFLALFGFASAQDLVGARVDELIAAHDLPSFVERGRQRMAGLNVENSYEVSLRRRDGRHFPGLVSVSEAVLADGPAAVAFIQDLSEPMRQRAAIKRERDRATQYLQIAQSILVALDDQGRVTMLNRRGHELLGWSDGEMLGHNWFQTCRPPDEADAALAAYRDLMDGRAEPVEYHESPVVARGGQQRWIAWHNALLHDEAGRIRGVLSSGEDITERRRADAELHALAASLEQRVQERTAALEATNAALSAARDAAEAGTRAKGEFLAHMSHEIRTPMNAIIGMTHLALQSPELPPRSRSYLLRIQGATDSLLAIINDLLDYSKIEAGRLDLQNGAFRLAEVLERLSSLIGVAALGKGLALTLVVDPEVPDALVGDPLRLGQVLLNLGSNAVKFTEQGAVSIHVSREAAAAAGRVRLKFRVRDTGIGITPEQQARLFQPFDQLDPSITRRYGGTGLGLAISHRLVELMGGLIGVTSAPGQGSEFRVTLDFELGQALALPRPAAPTPGQAPGDGAGRLRGRRLLLVEDNELNQIVASDLLTEVAGAEVRIAADGHQALRWLREERFDAVLMDLQMPQMDGFEATLVLRRDHALAALPVIAMTAHALARDRDRCLAVGMNDFVTKPIDPRELFAVLARWLPETPTSAPVDEEPAVRFELGLERCLGRRDLYLRILRRFLDTRGDDARLLADCIRRDDGAAARELAHTLISTAGTIGADALSGTARALQVAVEDDDRAVWPGLAARMQLQHAAVMTALREWLRETASTLDA